MDIQGVPILILLNKSDSSDYCSIDDANKLFQLEQITDKEITIMELSCLNNDNLHSLLSWLYAAMREFYKRSLEKEG